MADRYSRQVSLKVLGRSGQARLSKATVLVVGCGGLGCTSAGLLARAGVGRLVIADGGKVELSNLHRQVLFNECDIGRPKAMVAADRLHEANSSVEVMAISLNVNEGNVRRVLDGADVLVDGTDNMAVRRVLNRACVDLGVPWVYGGVAGTNGMTMTIVPRKTPCLTCVFPDAPDKKDDSLPIMNTLPSMVASIQATEAIKLLVGKRPRQGLLCIDAWDWQEKLVRTKRVARCPACGRRSKK